MAQLRAGTPDSRLPLKLALAYTALIVYASLHPLSGWHDSGAPPLAFLGGAWPRYLTLFDVLANVVGYIPLGFLWAAVLSGRWRPLLAAALVSLGGALLSLGMETTQNFLPGRVPSNLDLAANTLGMVLGAVAGGRWGPQLPHGRLDALRQRLRLPGSAGDAGLLILCLWLLTLVNPETLLLGNGDLRRLLDLPAPLDYSAERFLRLEAAAVATQGLAIGLLAAHLLPGPPWRWGLGLLAAAGVAKTLAMMAFMDGARGLAWATPGSLTGLAVALVLLPLAFLLGPGLRQALAAMALLFGAVLVNLAPDNPYLIHTLQQWSPGQFLHFHGLTRLASSLWPFLALAWLATTRPTKKVTP